MLKIEYVSKNFNTDRLALIGRINDVIDDYSAKGTALRSDRYTTRWSPGPLSQTMNVDTKTWET